MDIAEVLRKQVESIDAPVIQMDEAHSPATRKMPSGHRLTTRSAAFAAKIAHLCFGNYGGQSIQKGYWKDLMLFSTSSTWITVLEFARRATTN